MNGLIAVIPVHTSRGALGFPSRIANALNDITILEHTLRRVDRMNSVDRIILLHHETESLDQFGSVAKLSTPIETFAHNTTEPDRHHAARITARRWSSSSWRGGLGGTTVYDELLPARPIAEAMNHFDAASAMLIGCDWPLVDPTICDEIAQRHLEHAESMKLVFSQAPPGMAGIAVHRTLIQNMAENHAGFGQVFGYVPSRAQADPIGVDVCVQVVPAVRRCDQRLIYDTPRSVAALDRITQHLGSSIHDACVLDSAHAAMACAPEVREAYLPSQVTLELTPQRNVDGPLTPQHYVTFERPAMDTALAIKIAQQVGEAGDVNLMLGGLGDSLNHPDWQSIVHAAADAGVSSIGVETDLLCDASTLDDLIDSPVDIVSVRLNADTAACYEKAMGNDAFATVVENIQKLMQKRGGRDTNDRRLGLPWIVPRMIKTAQTLEDMETFFDRWVHFAGHAVIEPATTGRTRKGNLMPAQSPVLMAPPKRTACRQIARRVTILSNGFVAACDQDWQGSDVAGDTRIKSLMEIWSDMATRREAHQCGEWEGLSLCSGCTEWHRP